MPVLSSGTRGTVTGLFAGTDSNIPSSFSSGGPNNYYSRGIAGTSFAAPTVAAILVVAGRRRRTRVCAPRTF